MIFETVNILKKNYTNSISKKLTNTEILELQNSLLTVFEEFNRVCEKYEINYLLGGGTALGAVRNNGFIPWDDDIDINITRENYMKLLDVFPLELSEKYWLHTAETTPELGLGFARIRKKGTILKTREDIYNTECGVFIDLFVIEDTFNSGLLRIVHGGLSLFTGFLLSCRNFYKNKQFYLTLDKNNTIFKTKIIIGFLLSFLPVEFYTTLWNNINKIYKNNKSKFVVIPCGRNHFFKETYLREDIENFIRIKFENISVPISKNYDKYLHKLYGDYKKIPKEKESHIILDIKLK